MAQYLLATYADPNGADDEPSADDMQQRLAAIIRVEADMDAGGTFLFGGGLHDADTATVVRQGDQGVVMTDGPFVEAKEHIAGFYVIEAADLDEALVWAGRVTAAIGRPIEVVPFAATGRVVDHMGTAIPDDVAGD